MAQDPAFLWKTDSVGQMPLAHAAAQAMTNRLTQGKVVAELSYGAQGSNFNLQFGQHRTILQHILDYLGPHYGTKGRWNVSVQRGTEQQWLLMIVANCRMTIRGIGKPAEDYINHAQRTLFNVSNIARTASVEPHIQREAPILCHSGTNEVAASISKASPPSTP